MHLDFKLEEEDVRILNTNKGLKALLSREPYNLEKAVRYVKYERKLKKLQVELIRLQSWAISKGERIIVIFEGRDAAGKGGAIRRATERMNPRHLRIVALPKPTIDEQTQWYFQRYVKHKRSSVCEMRYAFSVATAWTGNPPSAPGGRLQAPGWSRPVWRLGSACRPGPH